MARSDDFEIVSSADKPQSKAESAVNASVKDDELNMASKEMKCDIKEEATVREPQLDVDADLQDEGNFAMRLYKYYTKKNQIEKVNLEIGSPYIRNALRKVVVKYPGQNLTGEITLTGSAERKAFACLYHYRQELRKYAEDLVSASAKRHVSLLLNLLGREFSRDIQRFEANLEADTPCVEFKDLWMLFKPKDVVFGGESSSQYLNTIVKVGFTKGCGSSAPKWSVTSRAFAHNGTSYGYIQRQIDIEEFEGLLEITELPCYPFKYHSDQFSARQYMIYRGRKYCKLAGIQYRTYIGDAVDVDKVRTAHNGRVNFDYPQEKFKHEGRIVLDCKSFIEERKDDDIKIKKVKNIELKDMTEDDFALCHYVVPGYSLTEKRWCWFLVDFVEDVVFDEGAFNALLLPQRQKRLVRALTMKHTSSKDGFDDLIHGKGRGCIFLLHGEPGIGKTFTAESIADDIHRPLYVLMSGELGSTVKSVDETLRKVLKLVTRWNAVLLIDEADVFLEKRSSHDLARNSLVSIFLRTLEYFSGVLFLTTNRINSFDLAFQSRIHLALKYHGLNTDARAQLWELFLGRTPDFKAEDWPDEVIQELAAVEINGRQIKNSVRTAYALAGAEKQKFSLEQVRDVLATVAEFQKDFNKETQARGTDMVEGEMTPRTMQSLGFDGEESDS
ncbi:P-loop containing nucleoside triphosphate hydrolase protein [Xylariaceae sp. FL0016]|nr:P-loop containing nucleoside triphosphate hydrolase protein [Xylariaceae sp. FL0016]